jgi:hypothetical protein
MNLRVFFIVSFMVFNIDYFALAANSSQGSDSVFEPAVKICPDSKDYNKALELFYSFERGDYASTYKLLNSGKTPYDLLQNPDYEGEITDRLRNMDYKKLISALLLADMDKKFPKAWFDPFLKSAFDGHVYLLEKMPNIDKHRLTFAVLVVLNKETNGNNEKLSKKDETLAYLLQRIGFGALPLKLRKPLLRLEREQVYSFPKTSKVIKRQLGAENLKKAAVALRTISENLKNIGLGNIFGIGSKSKQLFASSKSFLKDE